MKKTRSQMIDFVSFYRRQNKVSSQPSFSTLCAARDFRDVLWRAVLAGAGDFPWLFWIVFRTRWEVWDGLIPDIMRCSRIFVTI